jgi:hypothetical protein
MTAANALIEYDTEASAAELALIAALLAAASADLTALRERIARHEAWLEGRAKASLTWASAT